MTHVLKRQSTYECVMKFWGTSHDVTVKNSQSLVISRRSHRIVHFVETHRHTHRQTGRQSRHIHTHTHRPSAITLAHAAHARVKK